MRTHARTRTRHSLRAFEGARARRGGLSENCRGPEHTPSAHVVVLSAAPKPPLPSPPRPFPTAPGRPHSVAMGVRAAGSLRLRCVASRCSEDGMVQAHRAAPTQRGAQDGMRQRRDNVQRRRDDNVPPRTRQRRQPHARRRRRALGATCAAPARSRASVGILVPSVLLVQLQAVGALATVRRVCARLQPMPSTRSAALARHISARDATSCTELQHCNRRANSRGQQNALAAQQPTSQRRARSWCRRGTGEPSPGADVAAASPVPAQTWQG